jgi:thiamine-monophosphate kinase
MVEEIDFRVEWPDFDFRRLGRRLISINLSDLAAMGAEPRYALVSLTLRGTLPVADLLRLYQGIAEQARRFSCAIAGGDVSGTLGPLTLTATLVGRLASARAMLKRDGVRAGWLLAVTGSLGAAAAGLRLLESGRRPATVMERSWVSAQLDPTPRVIAGRVLVDGGIRVGGDISDGLYREVERLLDGTRLGAMIDLERLPLAPGLPRKEWALAVKDSEDFELVCAAPAARVAAARRVLERIKLPLTVVGEIEARPGIRLRNGSRMERLQGAGYEHFR